MYMQCQQRLLISGGFGFIILLFMGNNKAIKTAKSV